MTVAVTRRELSAADLRRKAVRCREAAASRRMLALASVLEGSSHEAARRRPAWIDRPFGAGCAATTRWSASKKPVQAEGKFSGTVAPLG
jgi:hypothetical protein